MDWGAPNTTTSPLAPWWVRGSGSRRRIGGVAAYLARRGGVDPLLVRLGLVLLLFAAGVGALLYGAGWLYCRGRPEPPERETTFRHNLGAATLTAAFLAATVHVVPSLPAPMLWAATFVSFGYTLSSPRLVVSAPTNSTVAAGVRILGGAALVVAGLVSLLRFVPVLDQLPYVLFAATLLVAGVGLVFAPWIVHSLSAAEAERIERVRAEERTYLAAHLHDSVLQTLNLIQSRANDPQVTAMLARTQERELRRWIHHHEDSDQPLEGTLRDALEEAASEAEATFPIMVECIVVGDCQLDHPLTELVAATKEALQNAGKFAESQLISLFAEVDAGRVQIFVRDRGVGFDPDLVADDRQGIRTAIRGRLERVGGTATIRSESGRGTEVCLDLPR